MQETKNVKPIEIECEYASTKKYDQRKEAYARMAEALMKAAKIMTKNGGTKA